MTIPAPSDTGLSDDEKCQTCNQTYGWHRENKPVHPFNTGQAGIRALFAKRGDRDPRDGAKTPQGGSQGAAPAPWPFDPVLRQALIDKGVLTPEDLVNAKLKIEAVTAQLMGGPGGQ